MKRRRELPAPRLIVHGVTAAEWTRRYGVVPFTQSCSDCGSPMTTSIPFVQGTLRGLLAPRCPCWPPEPTDPRTPRRGAPYAVVRDPKHGDLFSGDMRLDR